MQNPLRFVLLILTIFTFFVVIESTIVATHAKSAEPSPKPFPIFPYLHPVMESNSQSLAETYQQLAEHLPSSEHPKLDAARQAYLDLKAVDSRFYRQFMSHLHGWEFCPDDDLIKESSFFLPFDSEIRKIEKFAESIQWAQAKKDSACTLKELPPEYDIFLVKTYSGTKERNLQLGDSGHQVREADVAVGHAEKPVVLVLNSYGPTVWSIRRTLQTKIAGIIACGFLKQAVTGVSRSVPTLFITREGKECPEYECVSYKQLGTNAVSNILGKKWQDIRAVVKKAEKRTFWVPSHKAIGSVKLISSDERKVVDDAGLKEIPAGKKGIEKLIELGKLRAATRADIEAWIDKASTPYRRYDPDFRVETYLSRRDAVVVQKPFSLPSGLRGSGAYSFIIPEGLQPPAGYRGHNRYYYLESGRCIGGACCGL